MTAAPRDIRIGTLTIQAASGIEARRLAAALPAALERALATAEGQGPTLARSGAADRAAEQIVAAIRAKAGGPS